MKKEAGVDGVSATKPKIVVSRRPVGGTITSLGNGRECGGSTGNGGFDKRLFTQSVSSEPPQYQWMHWGPAIAGEVVPCFKGGFLYRIYDRESHTWAMYNDTYVYEMHATFYFSADSAIVPILGPTVEASTDDDHSETCITVVVYPMETVTFARGERCRHRSEFQGATLSKEYLASERNVAEEQVATAKATIAALRATFSHCEENNFSSIFTHVAESSNNKIVPDGVGFNFRHAAFASVSSAALTASELYGSGGGGIHGGNANCCRTARIAAQEEMKVLGLCRRHSITFVDPSFPPDFHSLNSVVDVPMRLSGREVSASGWQRPRDCVPPHLYPWLSLFGSGVSPVGIDRGDLGDAWVISAIAALAEREDSVKGMFRIPPACIDTIADLSAFCTTTSTTSSRKDSGTGYIGVCHEKGGVIIGNSSSVNQHHNKSNNSNINNHQRCTKVAKSGGGDCDEMIAYQVLLNKDGLWQWILIDAYLPVIGKRARFAKLKGRRLYDMWASYLEKAYAKRKNGYVNIINGDPLFALRDFTGFPTSRLDTDFLLSRTDAEHSTAFFQRLCGDLDNGNLVLLSAPGRSEERGMRVHLSDHGLLVGYAYTVLHATTVAGFELLLIRNPWRSGAEWKGRWCAGSQNWTKYPAAAAAFPTRYGLTSNGNGGGEGLVKDEEDDGDTLVLEWAEVLTFFASCGVVFNHHGYSDYRIASSFAGSIPGVCMEITVTEPISLTLSLSQPDHSGTPQQLEEYAPIMLSITGKVNDSAEYHNLANSAADASNPIPGFTFLQGRDVAAMYTFVPEQSPYLVVPRRLLVASEEEDLLFTLGVLSEQPLTRGGQAQVRLKKLSAGNGVFRNYARFVCDAVEEPACVQVKKGSQLNEYFTSILNA